MIMENGKMNFFGGDTAVSFANAQTLDEATKKQAVESFNKEVNKKTEAVKAEIDRKLAKGKEVAEKAKDMEIIPANSYILVRPYAENPFEAMREENGIIIPVYDGSFKNPDTGEDDKEYNLSTQADVIEVGPMVKYVRPGDVVYYREACQVPVPFFGQGLYVVSEHQIHVVINAGVKERFEKINNGLVDIAELPDFLGKTNAEKVENYTKLKKLGLVCKPVENDK